MDFVPAHVTASDSGVSVVVPAHNAMPEVLDTVASALAQSPAPLEVLVVDDRSTDGTVSALRERFGDRVRLLSGAYGSAAAARNAGWRAARGAFVAFLDADDLWFAGKLAAALDAFARQPEAAWFFSDGEYEDRDGALHASWLAVYADMPGDYVGSPVGELIDVNFVLTSSVVVRRDALVAAGGFDESLTNGEDIDLWIRLSRAAPAVGSPRPLVRYRHRPGSLSSRVEARLEGTREVCARLAADRALAPGLRARARRRASLCALKLAWSALRAGDGRAARARLRGAWGVPARVLPVAAMFAASFLPAPAIAALRARRTGHAVAAPALSVGRVTLTSQPAGATGHAR